MRKPLVAVALAASVSVVTSGCFIFTGVTLDKTKLKPDQKTTMKITARPYSNSPSFVSSVDYPFVFLRVPDSLSPASPMKFDVGRTFTRRGLSLKQDDELRDFILSEMSECGPISTSSSGDFYAFVTKKPVDDQMKPQKQAVTKLGVRQTALGEGNQATIGVAFGGADGDNDGIYENDDTDCGGGATPSVFIKPAPTREPTRADAREFRDSLRGD